MFFKKNIFLFFYFLMLILISCYEGTITYSRGVARGEGGGRGGRGDERERERRGCVEVAAARAGL